MTDQQKLLDAVLRHDFPSFIHKTFLTVSRGDDYLENWHIDCLAWHLEQCRTGDIKRLIVTVPPRNLKSICTSVAFVAWLLGKDPTCKVICASYGQDLANKHARDTQLVLQSDWYKGVFPKTRLNRKKSAAGEMETTRQGLRYATSVGGPLTGRGGSVIIVDDPIKPSEAASEAERTRVNEWFDNTLYSRLNNKVEDVIIVVMQRVHEDDLVGHILEKDDWTVVNIPAIADEDQVYRIGDDEEYQRPAGDILHPAREDAAALEVIRQNLGTYNFSAQYQQQPIPLDGNLVKWDWFRRFEVLPDLSELDLIVQSWDTASGSDELNDYSVCTTWGVIGSECYLIDVVRERLDYPGLRRRVVSEARKYDPDRVLIELAGSGTSLFQDLRMDGSVPVWGIKPYKDKVTRLWGESAKIEDGQVLIPESAGWLHDFQHEILAFPNGRHDDQVDSLSQALRWIRRKVHLRSRWDRSITTGPRERPRSNNRRRGARRRPISVLYHEVGRLRF